MNPVKVEIPSAKVKGSLQFPSEDLQLDHVLAEQRQNAAPDISVTATAAPGADCSHDLPYLSSPKGEYSKEIVTDFEKVLERARD